MNCYLNGIICERLIINNINSLISILDTLELILICLFKENTRHSHPIGIIVCNLCHGYHLLREHRHALTIILLYIFSGLMYGDKTLKKLTAMAVTRLNTVTRLNIIKTT